MQKRVLNSDNIHHHVLRAFPGWLLAGQEEGKAGRVRCTGQATSPGRMLRGLKVLPEQTGRRRCVWEGQAT